MNHFPTLCAAVLLAALSSSCRSEAGASSVDAVGRGRYLVQTMGCADCHTPRGPGGQPMAGRDLTGHPADAPLPTWDPSLLEKHGVATIAPTGTAFAGPFGVSVAPNLTPDPETGIARLTADALWKSWQSGVHWSSDRPILPPMPVEAYRHLSRDDVDAVHAYLHSLQPVVNRAPESVPAIAPGR